jgi:hypothetical protein
VESVATGAASSTHHPPSTIAGGRILQGWGARVQKGQRKGTDRIDRDNYIETKDLQISLFLRGR